MLAVQAVENVLEFRRAFDEPAVRAGFLQGHRWRMGERAGSFPGFALSLSSRQVGKQHAAARPFCFEPPLERTLAFPTGPKLTFFAVNAYFNIC